MLRHLGEFVFVLFAIGLLNACFRLGRKRTSLARAVDNPGKNVVYLDSVQRRRAIAR